MSSRAFAQSPLAGITFHAGGGVTPLTGQISNRLKTGWHVGAGAGVKFGSVAETSLDFDYHELGVANSVLTAFDVPDANSHVWSLTINPKFNIPGNSNVHAYVTGGVGYYRRTVEFTQPTVAQGLVFDPFFDTFFSVPFASNEVLGTISRSGVGARGGLGFEAKLRNDDNAARFFTEARYEWADTGNVPTRMIPVTFGIRW
jgi:opacity protein-like surface antigen